MGPLSGTRNMTGACINRGVVTEKIGALLSCDGNSNASFHFILEFFLNVSLNSMNSVTKVFVITLKRASSLPPPTKRPGCHHSTRKTRVKDRTFKFTPIHASDLLNSMKALLHLGIITL